MLILRNKGFHEFVWTIFPRSLFNTLMDLLYSAFVSKLFISNDSLILRSCMLDNFANGFWCSQLSCRWQTIFGKFSWIRRFPFSCDAIFFVLSWSSERMNVGLFGHLWLHFFSFFWCILNSYFPAPVFIIVTSKKLRLRDCSYFSILYCIALIFLFKIFRKLGDWCT